MLSVKLKLKSGTGVDYITVCYSLPKLYDDDDGDDDDDVIRI